MEAGKLTSHTTLTRRVRMLCELHRRARERGDINTSMGRRIARLVLQGVLERSDAQDALALILAGRSSPAETPDQIAGWLRLAAHVLDQHMESEDWLRSRVEADVRRGVRRALEQWQPADVVLTTARDINAAAGRPFVWPEVRRIAEAEAAWFVRSQSARPRHVR